MADPRPAVVDPRPPGASKQTMDQISLSRVLRGDLRDLPPLQSQVVRIFTSSTFTDTTEERNSLIETVYPRIQNYCRSQYGLEFQVVDMRWGVRDAVTDDHQVAQLCIDEIKTCQRLSVGPNFVAFLGQRHGHRPFPPVIDGAEFSLLLEELRAQGHDTKTLEDWFLEDHNSVPPAYILQPISTRIPDFLSADPVQKKQAQQEWNADFSRMQFLLREAATSCAKSKQINEAAKMKYFMSVTENEIYQGVFGARGDPNDQCLCFVRIIDDILENLSHSKAWRFIDMIDSSRVDEEAQNLLTQLRDDKLADVLRHHTRFSVPWCNKGGITRTTHQEYIAQFNEVFFESVKRMIDKGIRVSDELHGNNVYTEVLQHLLMAQARCDGFHGRDDVLQQIRNLVTSGTNQPIVVHGASGCGKTSVMSKCASLVREWLPGTAEPVVILRLLGTTRLSTALRQVLLSVCQQISACYDVIDFQPPDDFNMLVKSFQELLSEGSESKPLVVVLDCLDQLSSRNFAYRLGWLPKVLPEHSRIIVSTLSDLHGILDVLIRRTDDRNVVNIPVLGGDSSFDIVRSWLESNNRTLTDTQTTLVKEAFTKCSLALYVKLVFEEVLTWRSYTDVYQTKLTYTVRDTIMNLFSRLTRKYGDRFVRHSLGYVTASRGGLSETELADLLSLDDDVLTDVFQYHIPPVRRIPQLLWLRLKNDVSSYLVNREVDESCVIFWYRRQFLEVAMEFFLADENLQTKLHSLIADYFMGIWHGEAKPFTYNTYQMQKLGLSDPNSASDRKVAPQPLIFTSEGHEKDSNKQSRYNLRKLNNLPYHLISANRSSEYKSGFLYNYKWLYTKISACSVQAVLADIYLMSNLDEFDMSIIRVLRMRKTSLNKDPMTLAVEVTGSLLPTAPRGSHLWCLIDQCYREGPQHNALVARQHCYDVPGGPLVHTLEHSALPDGEKALLVLSAECCDLNEPRAASLVALSSSTNSLLVWDLKDGEIRRELKLWNKQEPKFNVLFKSVDGRKVACGCAHQTDTNPIVIYDAENDDICHTVVLDKVYPRVGFVQSFQIGLTGDKIIINVCGKEADCFDFQGRLLYSFNLAAASMYMAKETEVIFFLKREKTVQCHDTETGEKTCDLTFQGKAYVVALSPDGEQLFLGNRNDPNIQCAMRSHVGNTWAMVDTIHLGKHMKEDLKELEVFLEHPRDYLLITTTEDFILWDINQKQFRKRFSIPDHVKLRRRVLGFTGKLANRNKTLLCIYEEFILMWSVCSGILQQILHASHVILTDLIIIPDSSLYVTATSRNRMIKIWDEQKTEVMTSEPLRLEAAGRHSSIAKERHLLVVRSDNHEETRVIDVKKGKIISAPAQGLHSMEPVISPDGTKLILRDLNSIESVGIWSPTTGTLRLELPVTISNLRLVAISDDSQMLASHSETSHNLDVQTSVWDLNSGKCRLKVKAREGGINKMFFSDSDKYLVTLQCCPFVQTGQNSVIHVYSTNTGEEVVTRGGIFAESQIANIPNSPHILAIEAGPDGRQREGAHYVILDVTTGDVIGQPDRYIDRLSFTIGSDGKTLVDYDLRVIDVISGETLWDLSEDMPRAERIGPPTAPRVTNDGNYVVWSVPSEGAVKVGRLADKTVIGKCYVHSKPASVAISYDNIVSVFCDDGRVMLLQIIDPLTDGFLRQVEELCGFHDDLEGPPRLDKSNDPEVPPSPDKLGDRAPRAAYSGVCAIL